MNGFKPTYKGARDLPIYTATYKLLKQIDFCFDKLKRDRRHTLGQKIYNTALELFEHIRVANDFPEQREEALLSFLGKYDTIATLLKLCEELGYMPKDVYLNLVRPMASIERQANGWLLNTRQNAGVGTGIPESAISYKGGCSLPTDTSEELRIS